MVGDGFLWFSLLNVLSIIHTTTHSITEFTAELMFGSASTLDRYIIDHNPNLAELRGLVPESVADQHRLHTATLERVNPATRS